MTLRRRFRRRLVWCRRWFCSPLLLLLRSLQPSSRTTKPSRSAAWWCKWRSAGGNSAVCAPTNPAEKSICLPNRFNIIQVYWVGRATPIVHNMHTFHRGIAPSMDDRANSYPDWWIWSVFDRKWSSHRQSRREWSSWPGLSTEETFCFSQNVFSFNKNGLKRARERVTQMSHMYIPLKLEKN